MEKEVCSTRIVTISELRELVESLPEGTIIRVEFVEGTCEEDGE